MNVQPTQAPELQPAQSDATPDAPAVVVEGARLSYSGVLLFDGLSLTLPAGQITCLLGPSGVGKSSLLRLVAGLQDGGVDGTVRADDGRSLDHRIAYMAQQDLLLPWRSVLDNLLIGFDLRGEVRPRERALGLLEQVGLAAERDALPAQLSGGMRQRAALARTLVEQRPLVLMDEPFASLDVVTRSRLQQLAGRLLAGRTVLLVTHDPMEALLMADRVLVLAGRPAQLDPPLLPAGRRPRAPDDPALLADQAQLLQRLLEIT